MAEQARALLFAIENGEDIFEAYATWQGSHFVFPHTHGLIFQAKASFEAIDGFAVRAALDADVRVQLTGLLIRLAAAARKLCSTHRLLPHYCLLFHLPVFEPHFLALLRAALHFGIDQPVSVNVHLEQLILLLDACMSYGPKAQELALEMRPPVHLGPGEDFRDAIGEAMAEELRWVLEEELAPAAFAVGRAMSMWPIGSSSGGLVEASAAFYWHFA